MCSCKTGTQFYRVISWQTLINVNFMEPSKSHLCALLVSQKLESPILINVKTISALWSYTTFCKEDSQSLGVELVSLSLIAAWVCGSLAGKATYSRGYRSWDPRFFLIAAPDLSPDPRALSRGTYSCIHQYVFDVLVYSMYCLDLMCTVCLLCNFSQ